VEVANQVREMRERLGVSAADLADRVDLSRQAVHAIESGAYAPNTAVALKLARELGVSVEDLFQLAEPEPQGRPRARLAGGDVYPGSPLTLCRVGPRLVAAPWTPEAFTLPLAGAAAASQPSGGFVDVELTDAARPEGERLLLAGCDPAASILAGYLRRTAGVELIAVPSSSRKALDQLRRGVVHLAGTHLSRRSARIPKGCRVFTFAQWEEGLITAPGNPKNVREFADLARPGVRIINREPGAGSRALLDAGLARAGVDPAAVRGYDRFAAGHLAAAWAVRRGNADCCVAPRVAARLFGLNFLPLKAERYDLAVPAQWLDLPAVQALLDALQRKPFRRELAAAGGYETAQTGSEVSG